MEQADNHNTNSFQRRKIHAAQLLAFLAEKGSLTKEFVAPIDQEIWSLQCIFKLKPFYEDRMDSSLGSYLKLRKCQPKRELFPTVH